MGRSGIAKCYLLEHQLHGVVDEETLIGSNSGGQTVGGGIPNGDSVGCVGEDAQRFAGAKREYDFELAVDVGVCLMQGIVMALGIFGNKRTEGIILPNEETAHRDIGFKA